MNNNMYDEYCTGCGLCHSAYGMEMYGDGNGYLHPVLSDRDAESIKRICPAGGAATEYMDDGNIWGRNKAVYLGWSSDADIRKMASSGGVLTSLCCYLLDNHIVDGIIQTMASHSYHTKTVISYTADDVLKCMGSRYSVSAPLYDIRQIVKEGETYAFVGKPCDVSALRMYLKEDGQLNGRIKYLLSFFCAGTPGNNAQKKLLQELGCTDERDCLSLQYRGNGWPGYATVTKTDGTVSKMDYNESWGGILGRDVRKICRFCLDGIGEMADASCGDAWYPDKDNRPDFSEGDGRNVVFARTDAGSSILKAAHEAGYIVLGDYIDYDSQLMHMQKYQYDRRVTMYYMMSALRLSGRMRPAYNKKTLKAFSKKCSVRLGARRFLGTLKRAVRGKV